MPAQGLLHAMFVSKPLYEGDWCLIIFAGAKSAKNGVTCVWCRAPWAQAGTPARARAAGGSATTSEGYLNLSGVAGVSPVRDTSSCEFDKLTLTSSCNPTNCAIDYQGPRRGQRHYGYQDYEDDWRF